MATDISMDKTVKMTSAVIGMASIISASPIVGN